ncbi:FK506-binding protein 5-like [Helianthus annuus]|uniref:FK506-binding protein 5-like n=1 Tax=Helianthus annuus TaxID=4232 RepID=UPI000B8FDFB5|nr:FK506-binding protein 5-like [Helianthus annuus]
MAEAMQSCNVNQRFLPSMKSDKKTLDFNWCEYILNVLRRTRRQWPGNDKLFNGPIALLAILYACKKQGFDDAENTEEFSLDKINFPTSQEFEDELEIVAQNEGRGLKDGEEEDEFYVYPSESENENEEIFQDESEEKDEDDAEEQPNININSEEIEDGNTLLKAATDWIEQEDQEDVQNSQLKTNETEKAQTESGASWGQFFIKPSEGNKDKMWVDSQCRLRNFMPSQIQSEGLSDIHSTKSGDENMKNIEGKKSNEEYVVSALDYHFKGFEEVFESIESRIDEIIEEYPNSEVVHNKVSEWASLIEKFNNQAKKHKKVNVDSTLIETPSRFLNLSQNEDTENQIISTPLIVKRNDDATKRNEDNTAVVQPSNPEKKIIENEPTSSLQTHIENPSLVQSSFSEETPSLMLEIIKKTDEEEKNQIKKKIQNDEVPSFDLKISQLSSNVDENEVEVDTTRHAPQTEIQTESENKTIEKEVQITGIETMFERIEEQKTEKESVI